MPTRNIFYIACPAYALHGPIERQKVIESARWLAGHLGLEVRASPLLDRFMGHGSWLPAKDRCADLAAALAPEVAVVWACRGGFGSIDLVDEVRKSRRRNGPLLIGYSDITVLHASWAAAGWQRHWYGTLPSRPGLGRQGESLLALVTGMPVRLDEAAYASARVLRSGRASGPLFPACLSVLAGVCGTSLQPDLRGKILAIEDIRVHPFVIDFNLNQLHLSGALTGITGLLGGSFTCEERLDYLGPSVDEVLVRWAQRLRVPMISRLPFGHLEDPLVLPFGGHATVTARIDQRWSVGIQPGTSARPWT